MMKSDNSESSEHPSIKNYFLHSTQSPAANIFDQIAHSDGSSAMMISLHEPETTSVSVEKSEIISITSDSVTTSPTVTSVSVKHFDTASRNLNDNITVKEPVVCKIFAAQDVQSSSKSFFDMLDEPQSSQFTSSNSTAILSDHTDASHIDKSYISPSHPLSGIGIERLEDTVLERHSFESSPINPSETDRHRDAWIPCDQTRQALISVAISSPGTYFPEKSLLTMPGIMEEEMTDKVLEETIRYLGEEEASKRRVLTANNVTQDERGIRELIQVGCFRAAVNLTSRLLTVYGQGLGKAGHPSKHSVHSIQLWFTRIALLVKLREFTLAKVESEPFGDLDHPDLYFQFYPDLYGGRPGTLVPFSFRILLAELPQYFGKSLEALHKLHALLSVVRKIIYNLDNGLAEDGSPTLLSESDILQSKKLWYAREARVLHSIINCAVYQKDFCLAVEILELMLQKYDWSVREKKCLQSVLGRVYLQLGDIANAESNFNSARELKHTEPSAKVTLSDVSDVVDRGLLAVAQNAFQEAYECFKKASQLDPKNIMVLNNMAVCLLYQGHLKEALSLLEMGVKNDPTHALQESVLLNICTLYELQTSFSHQRKLTMLSFLSQYKGDGTSLACLKLQI